MRLTLQSKTFCFKDYGTYLASCEADSEQSSSDIIDSTVLKFSPACALRLANTVPSKDVFCVIRWLLVMKCPCLKKIP